MEREYFCVLLSLLLSNTLAYPMIDTSLPEDTNAVAYIVEL